MGQLNLPDFARIYIDTVVLIYVVEQAPVYLIGKSVNPWFCQGFENSCFPESSNNRKNRRVTKEGYPKTIPFNLRSC